MMGIINPLFDGWTGNTGEILLFSPIQQDYNKMSFRLSYKLPF